jgi:predicted transcriptional regulator
MAKTITVRVDDNVYEIIKKAAEAQKRTISNYIEYATINYTINEAIVDDEEMSEILHFEKDIKKGLSDVKVGRYKIVG